MFSVNEPPITNRKVILIAEFCDGRANSSGLYWQQIAERLAATMQVNIISPYVHPSLALRGCAITKFPPRSRFLSKFLPQKLYSFFRLLRGLTLTSIQGANVIVGTNPLFLPLVIPYFRLARVKSLTLLCYDLFPQNLMSQSGPIANLFLMVLSKLYGVAYRLSDNIIVVGRDMEKTLVENGIPQNKVRYIPNWGPSSNKHSPDMEHIRTHPLKILFFGALGRFQAIPELLEQVSNVQRNDVEFIFIGEGQHKNRIKKLAEQDARIRYLCAVPMSERDTIYKSAHISVVSVSRGMKGLCVPSKAYFALANGHPIIAFVERGSEIDILCEEFQCGWRIDMEESDSLSGVLEKIDDHEYRHKKSNIKNIPEDLINGDYSLTLIEQLMSQSDSKDNLPLK